MSQHIPVERGVIPGTNTNGRGIEFRGAAAYQDNILGYPSFNKVVFYEDFLGPAADETNLLNVNESHGGTGAINAAKSGTYRLTTSTTDDDKCEIGSAECWYSSCAAVFETRIKVDAITTVRIVAGFADAKSYNDDQTAFEISGTTITDRATDGVCFVFDTDATSDYWYYCNTKNGTAAGTSIAVAPTAATYEVLRVALDTSGNATFYRNGAQVGYKPSAITTTTSLTWYIAVQSLAGTAARNLDVDYIKCWQNRA